MKEEILPSCKWYVSLFHFYISGIRLIGIERQYQGYLPKNVGRVTVLLDIGGPDL